MRISATDEQSAPETWTIRAAIRQEAAWSALLTISALPGCLLARICSP
jgi:hypothetical protein